MTQMLETPARPSLDVRRWGIGGFLNCAADHFGGKVALIDRGRRYTYRELESQVNRLAHALVAAGVSRGDRVAIYCFNSAEFIIASLAVTRAGGIMVPLNFRLSERELLHQLTLPECSLLIFGGDFTSMVEGMRSKLPTVRHYICAAEQIPTWAQGWDELLARFPDHDPQVPVSLDDSCVIYHTAGTTGVPKGALRTHGNSTWVAMTQGLAYGFRRSDRAVVVLPMFHIYAFEAITLPLLMMGATIYCLQTFNPKVFYDLVEGEGLTVAPLVPAMAIALQNFPGQEAFRCETVRLWISASAPLYPAQKEWILTRFPGVELIEVYGMSEVGSITTLLPEDQLRKPASVGKADYCKRVRLLDEEGKEVPRGQVGEVVVQGPILFSGYYNDPEGTAELVRDGWFHTGDLGRQDEEGYLYLIDRRKDMIKSGGESIYSAEVEAVLTRHPKIKEGVVIGLPDQRWGEAVTAVVCPKEGEQVAEQELIDFCKRDLASYKCPKAVMFIEALPRNSFGKVLKRELRSRFAEGG